MGKRIFFDKNAARELQEFDIGVQKEFRVYIAMLASKGRLEFPEARKIDKKLFEIRVNQEGIYRGFYAYVKENYIVLLHFFQKKTQKTPLTNIKVAKQRLNKYA